MTSSNVPQLSAALDSVPAGFVLVDLQGRVIHVNRRAAVLDSDPPRLQGGQALPGDFPGWLDAAAAAEVFAAVTSRSAVRRVDPAVRLGTRITTLVIPVDDGVVIWADQPGLTEGHGLGDGGASTAMPRELKHALVQPLGTISNRAELIRAQSSDAIQRHAGEIVRIAAELAATIRGG